MDIQLTMYHLLLAFVLNRLVEVFKQWLEQDTVSPRTDRWHNVAILAVSFVLGALVMNTVFPGDNLFPTAATPFFGLTFTGVLIGGIANGWDLAGTFGAAVVTRVRGGQPQAF